MEYVSDCCSAEAELSERHMKYYCDKCGKACASVPKYSEHYKLEKIQEKSQAIGEFYHWAVNKGYISNRKFFNDNKLQEILGEFFGININKLEQEKKQMLEELKNA